LIEHIVVRRGTYFDSVTLMLLSRDASSIAGVDTAAVVAGTPLNRDVLTRQGFTLPDDVGPNDLVVAIRAADRKSAGAVADLIEMRLSAREHVRPSAGDGAHGTPSAKTVRGAIGREPQTNLLLVTVPGPYASLEVAAGLEAGLHVFCFSSGMHVEEEVALKTLAVERGLLLMGPDCGTAILDDVGLGFANVIRRGPVGVVGAAGTAIQELTCLLDAAGVGISHAIGVGGRDLSVQVGGLMTIHALHLLSDDPSTQTIVVLSKPPDARIALHIEETAAQGSKPVVVAFLGRDDAETSPAALSEHRVQRESTVEAAAARVAALHGRSLPQDEGGHVPHPTPGVIRGFFCGGSLCTEVMTQVAAAVGPVWSNIPSPRGRKLKDVWESREHTFIDFGDESLVEGRVHPMIDPSLRNERALHDCLDTGVGVVVVDVVLGRGAHDDPAGQLAPPLRKALEARGGSLTIVALLCGSQADPQDLGRQWRALTEAGAVVTTSAAGAARAALAATAWG
jgi:FdrA protein